jgi:hypothetical protein
MATYKLYDDGEYYIVKNITTSVIYRGHFSNVRFLFNNSQTTVIIYNLQNGAIFNTATLISEFENEFGQVFDYSLLTNYIIYNKTKDPSSDGGGLALVTTDATLTGDGTPSNPLSVVPVSDVNIYNSDGTLTNTRVVSMGDNMLNFQANQAGLIIESAANFTLVPLDILSTGNTYGLRVNSQLGIRTSGNTYGIVSSADSFGGYFYPTAIGGAGILVLQGVGDYAIRSEGRILVEGAQSPALFRVENTAGRAAHLISPSDLTLVVQNSGSFSPSNIGIFVSTPSVGAEITGEMALVAKGKILQQESITYVNSDSACVEFQSTTKGLLIPRMTTAQIAAIASPVNGLKVYNTSRNREEYYNGTYWRGASEVYSVKALTSSPVDAQTIYFGNLPKEPVTTAATSKIFVKNNGVIRKAEIYCFSGRAGTAENWNLFIRLNNTTDYLIAGVAAATNERIFRNNILNIPVNEGDFFEIKATNPSWATNPLTTIFGGNIIIE